jgi:VIT1/CCC1 family predicted Fe2+/Mn2+ transporter
VKDYVGLYTLLTHITGDESTALRMFTGDESSESKKIAALDSAAEQISLLAGIVDAGFSLEDLMKKTAKQ